MSLSNEAETSQQGQSVRDVSYKPWEARLKNWPALNSQKHTFGSTLHVVPAWLNQGDADTAAINIYIKLINLG